MILKNHRFSKIYPVYYTQCCSGYFSSLFPSLPFSLSPSLPLSLPLPLSLSPSLPLSLPLSLFRSLSRHLDVPRRNSFVFRNALNITKYIELIS